MPSLREQVQTRSSNYTQQPQTGKDFGAQHQNFGSSLCYVYQESLMNFDFSEGQNHSSWRHLTNFVFLDVLDCVSVLAPWAQVVHDTNDPGI